MTPKYEIFASMLTGSWMPWLENNRQQERFTHLLQPVNNSNGNACSHTFRMLVMQSGSMHSQAMQRFSREAGNLANACATAADRGGTAFFSLSAATRRQQFYNRLLGYCLNGYDQWATKLLSDYHGTSLCDLYRARMTDTLTDLLNCSLPWHIAEQPERLIACRARAALCVLLHRLTAAGSDPSVATDPSFNIRNVLLAVPEASVRDEIIELFDALTGEKKSPAPAPAVYVPAPTAPYESPATPPPLEHDLIGLIKEMKLDWDAMRQTFSQVLNAVPLKQKLQEKEPEQYLSGARVRELLSTSTSSLHRYRKTGELPYTKIGGRYCYSSKDVTHLIEKGKNKKINSAGKRKPGQPNY